MALIMRYFAEFGNFWADYVQVVESKPKMSGTKM